MKSTDQKKSIKSELNETLSNAVRHLQQESAFKTDSSQSVQSDSDVAQHFISVLEAAFIHGLKTTYFEKRKHSKELPKPQFWNLICKISHKDSLVQARKLNLIKTNIGRCRAWLRLALNDAALSSYLSSLLQTSEYKSLLNRYYDVYALFHDHEQSDIFLRYLQGAENLRFDLSCNSSVLNSWTRTPLEVAGITVSDSAKRLPRHNNNYVPPSPLGIKQSLSWHQMPHAPSLPCSCRESFANSLCYPFSTSPAMSVSSHISASLPSIQVFPSTEVDNSSLVEVTPHAGQAIACNATDEKNISDVHASSILHKRHLMKRKSNKSNRKRQKDEFTSSGSRCSSPSGSLSSNMSGGRFAGIGGGSRTNSISSTGTPLSPSPSEESSMDQNEDRFEDKNVIPPISHNGPARFFSDNIHSTVTSQEIQRHSTPVPERESLSHKHIKHRRHAPLSQNGRLIADMNTVNPVEDVIRLSPTSILNRSNDSSPKAKELPALPKKTSGKEMFKIDKENTKDYFMHSEHLHPVLSRDMRLTDVHMSSSTLCSDSAGKILSVVDGTSSPTTPQSDSTYTDEIMDIYARQPSASLNENQELDNIEESFFEVPCLPISPGHGNSLFCGVGWTSDHTSSHGDDKMRESNTSSPTTQLPGSSREESLTSSGQTTSSIIIYREGFLQKKGETLLFWRSRWFVLHEGTLSYYKDKKSEDALGVINLQNVQYVNDDDMNKSKSICLKMRNGVEHEIAAESKKLISSWAKDIRKVFADVTVNSPARSHSDSNENSFEVLEDIPKDVRLLSSELNTSWLGSMRNHMTRIANEKGLDAQNYQCADCASPIGMIYGVPRLCSFTGQYYCSQCHLNQEHLIPARMIHNWDFRKHKVAKRSKKFLEEVWHESCIDMDRVNPSAYRHLPEMSRLLPLRLKLEALQPYLRTCRLLPPAQLNAKLKGHRYMLDKVHVYSAHDLHKAQGGGLGDVISKAVTFGTRHVRSCDLCSVKGFVCEVCRKNEVIFAFETDATTQCDECKSVYHKVCLPDMTKCPKCERRNERMKLEEEELLFQDEIDEEERSQ